MLESAGNVMSELVQQSMSRSNDNRAVVQLEYGKLDPDYTTYDKGVAYAIAGNFSSAQTEFEKINKTDPLYTSATRSKKVIQDAIANVKLKKVVMHYFMAEAHMHNKQYGLAIHQYDNSLSINPRYVKTYLRQGWAFYSTNQPDRALQNYSRAIELDRKNSEAYFYRARLYMESKNIDLAFADFSQCIELTNDPDAYMNRALIHIENGDLTQAVSDANMMIRYGPNNPVGYNILGHLAATQNNKPQSCKHYKKACELGECSGYDEKKANGYCI